MKNSLRSGVKGVASGMTTTATAYLMIALLLACQTTTANAQHVGNQDQDTSAGLTVIIVVLVFVCLLWIGCLFAFDDGSYPYYYGPYTPYYYTRTTVPPPSSHSSPPRVNSAGYSSVPTTELANVEVPSKGQTLTIKVEGATPTSPKTTSGA